MISPISISAVSSAGNTIAVYEVPSGSNFATVSIRLANNDSNQDGNISLYIGSGTTPALSNNITPATLIPKSKTHDEQYLIMSPGEKLFVQADINTIAIRVHGLLDIPG